MDRGIEIESIIQEVEEKFGKEFHKLGQMAKGQG